MTMLTLERFYQDLSAILELFEVHYVTSPWVPAYDADGAPQVFRVPSWDVVLVHPDIEPVLRAELIQAGLIPRKGLPTPDPTPPRIDEAVFDHNQTWADFWGYRG